LPTNDEYLELFRTTAAEWLCDPYSIDIRYFGVNENNTNVLLSCSVYLAPISKSESTSLLVTTDKFIAGQEIFHNLAIDELHTLLNNLLSGQLKVGEQLFTLGAEDSLSFYSDMSSADRWFTEGHIAIRANSRNPISALELIKLDTALRANDIPFDGLNDLLSFLALQNTVAGHHQPLIEIRISPPIDIINSESKLSGDTFFLVLHAHPTFDLKTAKVAFKEFPEHSQSRKQISNLIKWEKKEDRQVGVLSLPVSDAFVVQVLLSLGNISIRRQFFDDTSKSPNRRYLAITCFDKELKRLKQTLTESFDAPRFEIAINALAYMLGLSGTQIPETNAPDLVLSSPDGNIVIIECTLRIADFGTKLGKLVERRNSLRSLLEAVNENRKIYAYLICGLPDKDIVYDKNSLADNNVTLLTRESLEKLLDQVKLPIDIEKLLQEDENNLEAIRNSRKLDIAETLRY